MLAHIYTPLTHRMSQSTETYGNDDGFKKIRKTREEELRGREEQNKKNKDNREIVPRKIRREQKT